MFHKDWLGTVSYSQCPVSCLLCDLLLVDRSHLQEWGRKAGEISWNICPTA